MQNGVGAVLRLEASDAVVAQGMSYRNVDGNKVRYGNAITRRWPEMHESSRAWRGQALRAILEIPADAVVAIACH